MNLKFTLPPSWAGEYLSSDAKIRILRRAAEKLEKSDPEAAAEIRTRLPEHRE